MELKSFAPLPGNIGVATELQRKTLALKKDFIKQ
jgi:hypothetical protein